MIKNILITSITYLFLMVNLNAAGSDGGDSGGSNAAVKTNYDKAVSHIKIAKKHEIEVFRGDEYNVFSRFILVADHYKEKKIFIRICGDNPFVDPLLIQELYSFHISNSDLDYSWNHAPRSTYYWPDGFGAECFTRSALKRAEKLVLSKEELEHVTLCFYTRNVFVSGSYYPDNKFKSNIKFDIDKPNQIVYLEKIIKKYNIFWDDSSNTIIQKVNK